MLNRWILTCRLTPKNCQTWRLWYLYLDGTMFKYGGPVPMFQAQELRQIKSTRTLSHERTMNLMRFGSVVIKSADLSRALETITMPLGMWLKDLLVNKRASLEDFRDWRCLLVTLYCSCCTANCKEKNNTYNIPEEKKKNLNGRDIGTFSMTHFLFMSKWYQWTFLTCFQFYYVLLSQ